MVRHRDLVGGDSRGSSADGAAWSAPSPPGEPAAGPDGASVPEVSAGAPGRPRVRRRKALLLTAAGLVLFSTGFAAGTLSARAGLVARRAAAPPAPPPPPATVKPPAEIAPATPPSAVAPAGEREARLGAVGRPVRIMTARGPGPLYSCIVTAPAAATGEARLAQDLRALGLGDAVELPGPPPRRLRVGGALALREALDLAGSLGARGHDVQLTPQARDAPGLVRVP